MGTKNRSPRILIYDIETAPLLGWCWNMWETNVIDVFSSWYMLSFSAKWLGSKTVKTYSLDQYPGYRKDRENDRHLVSELWRLFDEADIVIAHNGDRFDIKKSNARFIFHGLKPPSTYKTIDTLKIARRHFGFLSNKLNDLGAYLGVGRKLPHTGFHLWKGCMTGDLSSWKLMRRYNAQDVRLLERVYLKLRPWATNHPDLNSYTEASACPSCQSKKIQRRGVSVAQKARYQRLHCQSCGHWFKGSRVK